MRGTADSPTTGSPGRMDPPAASSSKGFKAYTREYDLGIGQSLPITWVCPETGTYRFHVWGQGSGASNDGVVNFFGGWAGILAIKTVNFLKGQTVSIASGVILTFPDGSQVTCTAATPPDASVPDGGASGVATGGDFMDPALKSGYTGKNLTVSLNSASGAAGYDGVYGGDAGSSFAVRGGGTTGGAGGNASASVLILRTA